MVEVFENLFATIASLQSKNVRIESIAMPLLGEQGIPRSQPLNRFLPLCKEARTGQFISKSITFAERRPRKVKEIDFKTRASGKEGAQLPNTRL